MKGALFSDWYARCYDGLRDSIPYRKLLRQAADCLPIEAQTLLDAGCGTGNLLATIRRRRRAIALHGIDFSEAMLRRARVKVPDAQFLPGDLNAELPYSDKSFDVVTCVNVLYAVRQPERTLAELKRVLKPGGTLIISSPLVHPRPGVLLQAHAAEAGWPGTILLLGRLTLLLVFNEMILGRVKTREFHFLDMRAVRKLLACRAITRAYANQNWFACAIKE
jgi:ubiquinone/menaquinone biosynthesis C-methylase UbiE